MNNKNEYPIKFMLKTNTIVVTILLHLPILYYNLA